MLYIKILKRTIKWVYDRVHQLQFLIEKCGPEVSGSGCGKVYKLHFKGCHVKVASRWLSHHGPSTVLPSTPGNPGKSRVTGSDLGKGRPGNPLHG